MIARLAMLVPRFSMDINEELFTTLAALVLLFLACALSRFGRKQ